jgi:prephenate dehydrogenase
MTRLAASSWDVWRGILMTNPAPIADALGQFIEKLTRVRDALPPSSDSASDLATLRALFQDEPSSGRTVR